MPPFCLATAANSVGDFGSTAGPLSVDTAAASAIAEGVLARGVDLTISARMTVDHGFVQPLEVLFGGIDRVPVVPVFINGVATPLGPVARIRALGGAIGETAAELDKRVLFVDPGMDRRVRHHHRAAWLNYRPFRSGATSTLRVNGVGRWQVDELRRRFRSSPRPLQCGPKRVDGIRADALGERGFEPGQYPHRLRATPGAGRREAYEL